MRKVHVYNGFWWLGRKERHGQVQEYGEVWRFYDGFYPMLQRGQNIW
jgi:hypothetical protein